MGKKLEKKRIKKEKNEKKMELKMK